MKAFKEIGKEERSGMNISCTTACAQITLPHQVLNFRGKMVEEALGQPILPGISE